jgi:lipopolysaccharide biosynthesis regulator YciM
MRRYVIAVCLLASASPVPAPWCYPKSADIDFTLGELHRAGKENDKAIARYRAALEKNPQHQGAKRPLTELTKQ